jgi:ferredoxin/flavodoxin---NADP+ reductase
MEKVLKARGSILKKAMEKYRFKVEPLAAPDGLVVEGDRLVGLRFRRTKMEGGKLATTDETFERRGPYVISSIGSIPEPIPAIPMKGELFAFTDWDVGRLDGYPSVFSVGNVVTGKGNIVASRKHAAFVSESAIEHFLGVADEGGHAGEEKLLDAARAAAAEEAEQVAKKIEAQPPLAAEKVAALVERVRARQREVGYGGDYRAWIEKVTPPDLE